MYMVSEFSVQPIGLQFRIVTYLVLLEDSYPNKTIGNVWLSRINSVLRSNVTSIGKIDKLKI